MKLRRLWIAAAAVLSIAIVGSRSFAQDADGDVVRLIVNLLGEKDKDLRAIALEQVRTEAKGEVATKAFAAQLPKLSADGQVALLGALADRQDRAARAGVIDLLKTTRDDSVRVAAISALGALGQLEDLSLLIKSLEDTSKVVKAAAHKSLVRVGGDNIPAAIFEQSKHAPVPIRVELIEILAARRALQTIPDLLSAAASDEPAVRTAAMAALGQMAAPEHLPGMVAGVLTAEKGRERDAAEKAIMLVCNRIPDADRRADPLLAVMEKLDTIDRLALLPTLGRIGGRKSLAMVEAAIASGDEESHAQGVRALCNWPDASVAPRLIELAQGDQHAAHREMALNALIRVAPLPDKRPPSEKLALLQKAMSMCTQDEDRKLVLKRAAAVRTIETLRFVLTYFDQPKFAEQVCDTIVELAHHRELREPNKAEFHKALDKVIATSKDATVVERANRYKRDQTWVRPMTTRE